MNTIYNYYNNELCLIIRKWTPKIKIISTTQTDLHEPTVHLGIAFSCHTLPYNNREGLIPEGIYFVSSCTINLWILSPIIVVSFQLHNLYDTRLSLLLMLLFTLCIISITWNILFRTTGGLEVGILIVVSFQLYNLQCNFFLLYWIYRCISHIQKVTA